MTNDDSHVTSNNNCLGELLGLAITFKMIVGNTVEAPNAAIAPHPNFNVLAPNVWMTSKYSVITLFLGENVIFKAFPIFLTSFNPNVLTLSKMLKTFSQQLLPKMNPVNNE